MTFIIKTRPLQFGLRHSYHIYSPIIYILINIIRLRLLQRFYNSIEYNYLPADFHPAAGICQRRPEHTKPLVSTDGLTNPN